MFNSEALGVLAITANPPTYRKNEDGSTGGHMGMAIAAIDSGLVGEVWVVPAYRNPAKLDMMMVSYSKRLIMTALSVLDLPETYRKRISARNIEKWLVPEPDNGQPVFTHAVLDFIAQMPENVERDVHLIVGSDYFAKPDGKSWKRLIPGWEKRWNIIKRGIVMVPRLYHEVDRSELSERVRLVDRGPLNGCSGDGRGEKDLGKLSLIVGPSVARYILTHNLYVKD